MIVQSNGITLRYEINGPPSAPVIILSHSLGVNREMWRPQQQSLSGRFRVICYDTRGHGGSSVKDGLYSMANLGKDVLGLMDHLSIDKAYFCGISMGGVIGQWLGIHAPQRLHGLILANTAAKIGTAESWDSRIAMVEHEGLGAAIPGTLERWFTPEFREKHSEIVGDVEAMLRKTEATGYLGCCAAIRDADFRSAVQRIPVPALAIAGTHDPVTSCADLHFLSESIPQGKYVELDTAHLSSVEDANEFTGAVLAFLGE